MPLLTGCLWIAVLSSVPSAPPHNLSVISVNSTTLTLSWDPPSSDQINGYIRHYTVVVTERETASEFQEQPTNTQVTIQSLHPYYTYTCRVAAVTTGSGPYTGNLTIQLPEDGKTTNSRLLYCDDLRSLRIKKGSQHTYFIFNRCLPFLECCITIQSFVIKSM